MDNKYQLIYKYDLFHIKKPIGVPIQGTSNCKYVLEELDLNHINCLYVSKDRGNTFKLLQFDLSSYIDDKQHVRYKKDIYVKNINLIDDIFVTSSLIDIMTNCQNNSLLFYISLKNNI